MPPTRDEQIIKVLYLNFFFKFNMQSCLATTSYFSFFTVDSFVFLVFCQLLALSSCHGYFILNMFHTIECGCFLSRQDYVKFTMDPPDFPAFEMVGSDLKRHEDIWALYEQFATCKLFKHYPIT